MRSCAFHLCVRFFFALALTLVLACSFVWADEITLPRPTLDGSVSVEKAITTRTTARAYSSDPLTIADVGQILWAGNGNIPTDTISGATRKVIPSGAEDISN